MFSIYRAIVWRMLRIMLPVLGSATLLIAVVPSAFFGLLSLSGVSDGFEVEPLQFHTSYVGLACFGFSIVVLASQCSANGSLSSGGGGRFTYFTMPVSTRVVVTTQMMTGAAFVLAAHLLIMACWKWLFGIEWPVLAPACLIVASSSLTYAVLWWPGWDSFEGRSRDDETSWRQLLALLGGIATLSGLVIWWVSGRYYPEGFAVPVRFWSLTVSDAAILAGLIAASWLMAVTCAGWQRCGEGVWTELCSRPRNGSLDVANPALHATRPAAIYWLLRQPVRRIGPITGVAFALLAIAVMSQIEHQSRRGPTEEIAVMLTVMPALAGMMIGAVVGASPGNVKTQSMRSFLATMPLTDAELGRVFLKAANRSSVLAWTVSFGLTSLFLLWLLLSGDSRLAADVPHWWVVQRAGWLAYPLTPVCSMILMVATAGGMGCLLGTGRPRLIGTVYGLLMGGLFVFCAVQGFVISTGSRDAFRDGAGLVIGAGSVLWTLLAFYQAFRSGLIDRRQIGLAGLGWGIEVLLCWALFPIGVIPRVAWSGVLSLTVSPVAAAPLAVSLNRHR